MRILFVIYDNEGAQNPIPMGSAYVAGYLKQQGYDVSYYSQDVYHYPEEHLTDYLNHNHFDVVGLGFCAGYFQYRKILKICEGINKSDDRPLLILGGHGPSPVPEFFLEKTGADAVVVGEGEVSMLYIVKSLELNGNIPSIIKSEPLHDIDLSPYYKTLPMEYYLNGQWFTMKPTDKFLPMITSRGCPYSCNFCQRLEKSIRFRSIPAIVEELGRYVTDYHVNFVQFWDELFVSSPQRVYELTQAIKPSNINYWCTARVNIVTSDIIKMLKESGCVYIDYGIEQFDNDALRAMNKKQTEKQIIDAIEMTQAEGIKIGFNIIWGNVGDTVGSLIKSANLLRKYNDYGQLRTIRPVTPYPGCPLYQTALDRGLLTGPEDFYEKHKNVELLTCNFTNIPDDEFHGLLDMYNGGIIGDYFEHKKNEMRRKFHSTYFDKEYSFRGARHT